MRNLPMNRSIYCVLALILIFRQSYAQQKFTISGSVRDSISGEDLIGATLTIKELPDKGAITNAYGFYSLTLPAGNYTMSLRYIGYEHRIIKIELFQNLRQNYALKETIKELQEVTVADKRSDENVTNIQTSLQKLDTKEIRNVPVIMGERDVLKTIQLLPGIKSAGEGGSGFNVRGGASDQNLILLDEATVYNASHLMGFFSVFNNDAIKDVKLYKGDIPAEQGGRLSSLLDVRMKDGNNKKFSASGGIGTISSRLTLEGPIVRNRTSFILSARRTYADLFLPLAKDEVVRKSKLFFYDLNAKFNHIINENNRIYFSGYSGRDVFKYQFAGMEFGNNTFTLRWNHLFSPGLFSNFTLIQSNYHYQLSTPEGEANSFQWTARMHDFNGKVDFNYYITPGFTFKFGAGSILHKFRPGNARGLGKESLFTVFTLPDMYALENNIYLSVEQSAGYHWRLRYGLRLSTFHNIGKAVVYNYDNDYQLVDSTIFKKGEFYQNYATPEPRIALTYIIDSLSSIKLSYSRAGH